LAAVQRVQKALGNPGACLCVTMIQPRIGAKPAGIEPANATICIVTQVS
jgi:hypothetical protein